MPLYKYSGPVLSFERCIAHNWTAETRAPSKEKALSNLRFQFTTYAKLNCSYGSIRLPGKLTVCD